ncbi:photosynthetic complex putative assembly protein PuhB [Hydrogenophaga flava]|uniref:photosynthetic complex putative assembly protein PuhB n=1 Tax=Hydrogenophaga flava TaxID=65657 RepID=UPI000A05E9C9|nr:photosynthetic complex putative assembly protein PuhB [Hydrogenophaga flava]
MNAHHEHEFEAAPGLPEPLPRGERLIWQGSPDWVPLAIHAFHVRKLAIYFAGMLGLQALYLSGDPQAALLKPLLTSAVMAALALLLLGATAWFAARTTLYTLTDRRIVMRIGVVLTLTLNLPLRQIAGASFKPLAGGHGDIALSLAGKDRIAFLNLWPHARAWQLKNPQPSLRCLPGAAAVGERIQQAWLAANPQVQAQVGAAEPAPLTPVAPVAMPNARPVREHGVASAA